jgi:hypothetical protein
MKKHHREYLKMVAHEGGEVLSFHQGKKHIKVTIQLNDSRVVVQSIAVTPSDSNWVDKTRQDFKRITRGAYAHH